MSIPGGPKGDSNVGKDRSRGRRSDQGYRETRHRARQLLAVGLRCIGPSSQKQFGIRHYIRTKKGLSGTDCFHVADQDFGKEWSQILADGQEGRAKTLVHVGIATKKT
jgi:hypothetical protein